jgi:hypothetical protein
MSSAMTKPQVAVSQTMNNKLVTPAEIQWGTGPAILPEGAQGR